MFCVEESCGINEKANPVSPAAVAHSPILVTSQLPTREEQVCISNTNSLYIYTK